MNYSDIYNKLMDRAKSRGIEKPFDRHHIVPRSLGGGNEKENIVKLNAREHIFAHVLLAKIHHNNFGLVSCAFRMLHGYRSSKRASWLRDKFILGMKENNNPLRRKDAARKVAEKLRGVPRSEETKRRVSDGLKRYFSVNKKSSFRHSEESKKRLSDAQRGRVHSAEHIAARVASIKGKRWITDGERSELLCVVDAEQKLKNGWRYGRSKFR